MPVCGLTWMRSSTEALVVSSVLSVGLIRLWWLTVAVGTWKVCVILMKLGPLERLILSQCLVKNSLRYRCITLSVEPLSRMTPIPILQWRSAVSLRMPTTTDLLLEM